MRLQLSMWRWQPGIGGGCCCCKCNTLFTCYLMFLSCPLPGCRPKQTVTFENTSKADPVAVEKLREEFQPHAHMGFMSYMLAIEPAVTKALGEVAADGARRRLWIAGHSMGGQSGWMVWCVAGWLAGWLGG